MNKDEIKYLYEQGFSISEIQQMEKPLGNLSESDKARDEAGVEKEPKEEPKKDTEEKKTSSESSSVVEKLEKQIEDLKKIVQKQNREDVENPSPVPARKSTEEIMLDYFKNL